MKYFSTILFFSVCVAAFSQTTFQKNYNVTDYNSADVGYDVIANGNKILMTGLTACIYPNGSLGCASLIETDEHGIENWVKIYDAYPYGFQIVDTKPAPSGGYYSCGATNSPNGFKPSLMRLDENGDSIWLRHYDNVDKDFAYELEILDNGNILILGTGSFANNHSHFFLLETDSLGNVVYDTLLGIASEEVLGGNLAVLPDGNLAVGYSASPANSWEEDLALTKMTPTGGILWTKTYQGNEDDYCRGIMKPLPNGGFVMSYCEPDWSFGKIYKLFGLDSEGEVSWGYTFDHQYWETFNINTTANGDIIGCGYRTFDGSLEPYLGWIFRVSGAGELLWQRAYRPVTPVVEEQFTPFFDITETADGGFASVGKMTDSLGLQETTDVWLLKVDADGCLTPGCTEEVITFSTERRGGVLESVRQVYFRLSPNPVAGEARAAFFDAVPQGAAVKVFNGQGQLLRAYPAAMGSMEVRLDFSGHPAGLYSVVYEVEGRVMQVERVVRE